MINVEISLSNNIGSSISQTYRPSLSDVFGRISAKLSFFADTLNSDGPSQTE